MEEKVRQFLQESFPDAIVREDSFRSQQSFYITPDSLLPIVQAIVDDTDLDTRFLSDITSVDWLGHEEEMGGRFEVVYNFYSLSHKYRFFLKVMLPEDKPEVDTLIGIFNSANWLEREIWDMMGITFIGHPDLTKILTADDLDGHPLRRDFPLTWEQPRFTWNKDDPPEVIK
jgi:NADH-quinone oxidoreductase subunit C